MPVPPILTTRAGQIAPLLRAGEYFDAFDIDKPGILPSMWSQFGGGGGVINSNRQLEFSVSSEQLYQFRLPPSVNWLCEFEMIRVSGTPDESFQFYAASQTNATKYNGGIGFSGSKIGLGKNVANVFTNLATLGTISEVPVGVPVRFRFVKINQTLILEIFPAPGMTGGRISVSDTSITGALYPGFDSYAGAAKVTRLNWIRVVRL